MTHYLPHLPAALQGPVKDAIATQRLRTMPNSFLPPSMQGLASQSLSGAIMVGDAYNMRHPLTGGGMTVAFNDAVILTRMLKPGGDMGLAPGREGMEDWDRIAEGLRGWFWERKNLSGVVNVLSMALYDLFGGSDGESRWSNGSDGCGVYVVRRADGVRNRFGRAARGLFQVLSARRGMRRWTRRLPLGVSGFPQSRSGAFLQEGPFPLTTPVCRLNPSCCSTTFSASPSTRSGSS